jgi:hypothetical protein
MSRHSRIGLTMVLAVACAVGAPAAQAGYVTPDSIASPVLSSSTSGGLVAAGGLVTDQYQGLGLLFTDQRPGADPTFTTAVIRINNRDVFTGAYQTGTASGSPNHVSFQSPAGVSANLVAPGAATPDVADSVTISFDSTNPVLVQLEALDKNGHVLKSTTAQVNGVLTPVELDVAGIRSIYATAFQPIVDPLPGFPPPPHGYPPYAWGVASLEWHEAPEPAGFVLGGLGMIAVLGYAWRRRLMRMRLGVRGA